MDDAPNSLEKDILYRAYAENLVPYQMDKIVTHSVLWADGEDTMSTHELAVFKELYSYSSIPQALEKDLSCGITSKTAHAERYGGYGLTKNGGGSRCAVFGDVQVKGSGINPLSGAGIGHWYSHGALNITDAVLEVVYATLLNEVTPIGAAKALGVIVVAPDSAYHTESLENYDARPCWGAMLVRQTSIRPAHFLRSMYFQPKDEHASLFDSDIGRLRRVFRKIGDVFQDAQKFALYLMKFVHLQARQLAFCKAVGISHGGITPSNMTMNGQWIDVTTSTFMDSGKNYINDPENYPAFAEHSLVQTVLYELAYSYSKYTGNYFNFVPIAEFYHKEFQKWFHVGCAFVFGVPESCWPTPGTNQAVDYLVYCVKEIQDQNAEATTEQPSQIDSSDPLLNLMLYSVGVQDTCDKCFSRVPASIDKEAFARCLGDAWRDCAVVASESRQLECVQRWSLTMLRRRYCACFYYRGWLRDTLEAHVFDKTTDAVQAILRSLVAMSKWAFIDESLHTADMENQFIVFQIVDDLLSYRLSSDEFIYRGTVIDIKDLLSELERDTRVLRKDVLLAYVSAVYEAKI